MRYRDIYDLVHGDGFQAGAAGEGYRANVRGFIKRIRRKFEEMDPAFSAIENYPGFGYRLRAQGAGEVGSCGPSRRHRYGDPLIAIQADPGQRGVGRRALRPGAGGPLKDDTEAR